MVCIYFLPTTYVMYKSIYIKYTYVLVITTIIVCYILQNGVNNLFIIIFHIIYLLLKLLTKTNLIFIVIGNL